MSAPYFIKELLRMGGISDEFSTWERQTFPQQRNFLPQKDFFCLLIYATAHIGEHISLQMILSL